MDREGSRRVEKNLVADAGVMAVVQMSVTPPDGRKFWLDDSMLPQSRLGNVKPTFKVGEVAKIFFARSPDWMRWLGTQQEHGGGVFELNGREIQIKRTHDGARIYTLVDVERIAHALLEHGKIDVQQFVAAMNTICWMAYNYKVLTVNDMVARGGVPGSQQGEQLVIEGIDEQIEEIHDEQRSCDPCNRDEHNRCDLAADVAMRTWSTTNSAKPGVLCQCYLGDIELHT